MSLSDALIPLALCAFGCSCQSRPYTHHVIDAPDVFVGSDRAYDDGELVLVDRVVVEPRGDAKVERIKLVWFVDRDADGVLDPGEQFSVTESRPDPRDGRTEWRHVELPRGVTVHASIEVDTDVATMHSATWKATP